MTRLNAEQRRRLAPYIERAAYHEAGHAIACVVLRLPFATVGLAR